MAAVRISNSRVMGYHLVSLASILFLGVFASATYSKCNFDCGKFRDITYPFWTKGLDQANCGPYPGQEDFELLTCDSSPSITIRGQTIKVMNISNENKTMRLSLLLYDWPWRQRNDNSGIRNPSSRNVTMSQMIQHSLVFNFTIRVFSGCDLVNGLPSSRRFKCGMIDWGTEFELDPPGTASEIVNSCKIHIEVAVMNGTKIDKLRSCDSSQALLDELFSALHDRFEVHSPPPQPPPLPQPPPPLPQPSPTEYKEKSKTGDFLHPIFSYLPLKNLQCLKKLLTPP
uniref:Wall-associated receptor kinase galacturonan-binding domain-containing protein n=1 Tax=Kalanchoe fedtschenkoi TaxID=63787 RepID=A0A7N0TMP3_KALFE